MSHEMKELVGWGQIATGVPEAWKQTKGQAKNGRRVRIAVCDTGVDRVHRDGELANCIKASDTTGHGPDDSAEDGHGTHVLGIIGARSDDRGIVGFCPEAELISIKCLHQGTGSSEWVADAIRIAMESEADIISMSLGSPYASPQIAQQIEEAVKEGIFVICAAGNSGRPDDVNFPARWKGQVDGRPNLDTIAVAATTKDGKLATYSSRGPEVDIAAPGTDITSTWVRGGYSTISGTSMACPAVSGIVGLMLVIHWDLGSQAVTPLRTMAQLREHLKEDAVDMGAPGYDQGTGWGLIKADSLQELEESPIAHGLTIPLGPITIHMPPVAADKIGIEW
jgi:subtilisin family serine protease